jgi:hypothetical protein
MEPPLSFAVPGFFSEQLSKHQVRGGTFRQTMSMAAVCAGDVIRLSQRFADTHGNGFFANVKMSEARHERACVEIVDFSFKNANRQHLPVHS